MLQILIYGSLVVFIALILARAIRIARMPVHLRWELYPVPHEPPAKVRYGGSYMEETDWWTKSMHTNKFGELRVMLAEIFLLKGIWEHNRPLWLWSWMFHWGLYLLILSAVITIGGAGMELAGWAQVSPETTGIGWIVYYKALFVCYPAFILGIIGTLGVLVLRLTHRRMMGFTSFGTVFNLLLILTVCGLGLLSLLTVKDSIGQIFSVAGSLMTFKPIPSLNGMVTAYLTALTLFLFYFPFTHMTHAFFKYFTYHSVRWDDRSLSKNEKLTAGIERALHYPVSWSAPHIRGDGKKNWLDVVGEGVEDE